MCAGIAKLRVASSALNLRRLRNGLDISLASPKSPIPAYKRPLWVSANNRDSQPKQARDGQNSHALRCIGYPGTQCHFVILIRDIFQSTLNAAH
jgi:hypothetical protein